MFVRIAIFVYISIHALREEGDARWHLITSNRLPISIHALREVGDLKTTPLKLHGQ